MSLDPEYYEREKLSAESLRQRENKEAELEAMYAKLREIENPLLRMKQVKRIDALETMLSWQGANPKEIPFKELKAHVQAPHNDDPLENKYRKRIKNRATAIRAFCVQSMGGDTAAVRECPALTCPLHPFRMGKDPLRGWDIPKVDMPPIEGEDEDDGLFEEGDDGNDADAKD